MLKCYLLEVADNHKESSEYWQKFWIWNNSLHYLQSTFSIKIQIALIQLVPTQNTNTY